MAGQRKRTGRTSQSQFTENLVVTKPVLVEIYWKGKLMLPFQTVLGRGAWAETRMQTRAYCWLDTATTELPLHCESPSLLHFIWFHVVRHRASFCLLSDFPQVHKQHAQQNPRAPETQKPQSDSSHRTHNDSGTVAGLKLLSWGEITKNFIWLDLVENIIYLLIK